MEIKTNYPGALKRNSLKDHYISQVNNCVHIGLLLLDLLPEAQRLLRLIRVYVLWPAALHMINTAVLRLEADRVDLMLREVLAHLDAHVNGILNDVLLVGRLVRHDVHVQFGGTVTEVTLTTELTPFFRIHINNLHSGLLDCF